MRDLIDLGNLAFDQLVKEYGESPEGRLLFLYGVTNSTRWNLLNSSKWVLIEADGLSKNFEDATLSEIDASWKALKSKADADSAKKRLDTMRAEYDRPAPTAGDIFEFGKSSGEFREISF
jgi:hypothetical protein